MPVGGFKAIQKKIVYPESARKSGISGKVIAFAHFTKKGKLDNIKIKESLNPDCDKAAIKALKSVKWKPALKGNDPVAVWVDIPIQFSLHGGKKKSKDLPPPPKGEREIIKVDYDTPPEVIGGFKQIGNHLVYPEKARKTGLEGKVVISAQINKMVNLRIFLWKNH